MAKTQLCFLSTIQFSYSSVGPAVVEEMDEDAIFVKAKNGTAYLFASALRGSAGKNVPVRGDTGKRYLVGKNL